MPESLLLEKARAAMDFVRRVANNGTDNPPGSYRTLSKDRSGRRFQIDEARASRIASLPIFYGQDHSFLYNDCHHPLNERWLMDSVVDVMATGQGRCEEQAALAYYYLAKKEKLSGVGVFMIKISGEPGSSPFGHAFVVMGLSAAPVTTAPISYGQFPSDWTNAVWCDPWADKSFEIKSGWPHEVVDILRVLPDYEKALRIGMQLICAYYHDGSDAGQHSGSASVST